QRRSRLVPNGEANNPEGIAYPLVNYWGLPFGVFGGNLPNPKVPNHTHPTVQIGDKGDMLDNLHRSVRPPQSRFPGGYLVVLLPLPLDGSPSSSYFAFHHFHFHRLRRLRRPPPQPPPIPTVPPAAAPEESDPASSPRAPSSRIALAVEQP
ncbi:hypothetical protein ACHAWF_001537, partial [Thalassiosira exigua]